MAPRLPLLAKNGVRSRAERVNARQLVRQMPEAEESGEEQPTRPSVRLRGLRMAWVRAGHWRDAVGERQR